MTLVLGVDASTTSVKAIAWDEAGTAVAEARAGLDLANPGPDAWEQDAEGWWTSLRTALSELAATLGPRLGEVQALCIAHQRETFVFTDDAGAPRRPAVVWMDARARAEVQAVSMHLGASRIHDISGKPVCLTPSLYKALYVLEREPALREGALRLCDVHAFLSWRLTGRFATSLASADPLGLVDMRARDWSEKLLGVLGLHRGSVPELLEPGEVMGRLTPDAATATGLPSGLPLVAGAGDGQAAGLGAGITGPGRAYLNLGTAIVSGVLSDEYRTDPTFRTLYAGSPGEYFLETDLKGGTFTLTWLVEKLLREPAARVDDVLAELERDAARLPPGADGLMLVPYWNGVMNPYWDDDATGITVGWHGAHGPEHVYRAVLEGIAMEQRLHTAGVELALGSPIDELIVMGGGSKSELWCQILADVTGKRVVRSGSAEATALGAAVLAAAATGVHGSIASAAEAMTRTGDTFAPGVQAPVYAELYDQVFVELYPALREATTRLAALRARARTPSFSA